MALKSCCYFLLLFLLSGAQGDCPAPETPPHAVLNGDLKDSYPVGTTLRYSCIPGYQFIYGSIPTIKCLENSTWSQTPVFCEPKRCTAPDFPNGKIEGSDKLELGEEITFVCNYGYKILESYNTSRCVLVPDNKVQWDKSPPSCEIIECERPPNIANGTHNGDESHDRYTVSTVIKYTCNKDFSLIGSQSITCIVAEDGVNGKWDTSPPECKVVQCSRPEIENGKLTTPFQPSYDYEHTLQFTCNFGYTLVGNDLVTCGADSTWKPELPTCVKVRCNRPEIENGNLTSPFQPSYDYEHTLQFICNPGYTLVGKDLVTCGADSTWKPELPTCVKDTVTTRPGPTLTSHTDGDKKNVTSGDCPAPETPPHAVLNGDLKDSYPVGTTLRYSCIPGYQFISGSIPIIKCLENSTWSQTPVFCEPKRCTAPDFPNGKIEGSDKLELDEEITFVCNYGYKILESYNTSRCVLVPDNKVQWDKSPPSCEIIECERPPNIANGTHNGDESHDRYTVSTVIKYICNKGFSLIGSQSITCIVAEDGVNGKWDTSPPECKVVQCSRPEIENGKLTTPFQPSYDYEHTLQFTCNFGYTLVGNDLVTCGADSTWKPELPTCVKGPTRKPSTTVTKPDSGNNSVAIVAGKLTIILVLLVLMV
ncbi:complement receptor type 2 isoform X2 [Anolis carolinensis]|uniref:complement receptor type 2 isoform X2 n=1 Tax=Anolis carolinensis TaxID=28377 RepID=UPI002F2B76EE